MYNEVRLPHHKALGQPNDVLDQHFLLQRDPLAAQQDELLCGDSQPSSLGDEASPSSVHFDYGGDDDSLVVVLLQLFERGVRCHVQPVLGRDGVQGGVGIEVGTKVRWWQGF